MTTTVKSLFAGAAVLTALMAAAPVSAATIIVAFQGGPFSGANPIGTLPATALVKSNTYDFTFTVIPPLPSSNVTSLSTSAQLNSTGAPEPVQYQVYSGTPGSGTFMFQSSMALNPVTTFNATPGDYYLEVTGSQVAVNHEVISGSIDISAVPEPASWAMMLVGFGVLGGALRRRSARNALA